MHRDTVMRTLHTIMCVCISHGCLHTMMTTYSHAHTCSAACLPAHIQADGVQVQSAESHRNRPFGHRSALFCLPPLTLYFYNPIPLSVQFKMFLISNIKARRSSNMCWQSEMGLTKGWEPPLEMNWRKTLKLFFFIRRWFQIFLVVETHFDLYTLNKLSFRIYSC